MAEGAWAAPLRATSVTQLANSSALPPLRAHLLLLTPTHPTSSTHTTQANPLDVSETEQARKTQAAKLLRRTSMASPEREGSQERKKKVGVGKV